MSSDEKVNATFRKWLEAEQTRLSLNFNRILDATESPIERLLVAALLAEGTFGLGREDLADWPTARDVWHELESKLGGDAKRARGAVVPPHILFAEGAAIVLQPTVTIGGAKYRLDMLMMAARHVDGPLPEDWPHYEWFAIECDGHGFHERTKQQAQRDRARDRALTKSGWKVMRFTGSEIFARPNEVAGEIVDAYLDTFLGKQEAQ